MEVIRLADDHRAGPRDGQALDEILRRSAGSGRDWRQAKVCQVCGELARISTWEEWCAAHLVGGEFKGFQSGHEGCNHVAPGCFAARAYRFCELCRVTVPHVSERRLGLSWSCRRCEIRVRQARHDPRWVLDELARARFEHAPVRAFVPAVATSDWPDGPRVAPPRDWLPPGLYPCPKCSKIRGSAWSPAHGGGLTAAKSTCLCEGIDCRRCGVTRIRRPVSDYYDPLDGSFWHVPYFVGMSPCGQCRAQGGLSN